MLYWAHNNSVKNQMAPAFKSLSFKSQRLPSMYKMKTEATVFPETQREGLPKVASGLPKVASGLPKVASGLPKVVCDLKTLSTRKEDLKTPSTHPGDLKPPSTHNGDLPEVACGLKPLQKEFKSKVYGAIMRYKDKNTNKVYYALIQGRYTGKWSFPKGHSKKGEEPYDCVMREIFEETGIIHLPNSVEDQRIGFGHYYIFDVEIKYNLQPQDKNEVMNTIWVSLEEMNGMKLNVDASYFLKKMLSELPSTQ